MKWIFTLIISFSFSLVLFGQDIDTIIVKRLPNNINSSADETHPIAFGEDILYYSSSVKDFTKIYRTEKLDRTWKEPLEPNVLQLENLDFKAGTFTPNKQRFYFTVCENDYCVLYCMQRTPSTGKWAKPIKLSNRINLEGTNTIDPTVMVRGSTEYLYFASDRKGGFGGYDLWYVTKDYDSDEFNFSDAINLGEQINTDKDEITPFFSFMDRELYFSSNGHTPQLGQFDIYKSENIDKVNEWSEVALLPEPINSSADDAYFVLNENLDKGYFSSNRFTNDRIKTQLDFDLYTFRYKSKKISLEGNIYEAGKSEKRIPNVMVSLYEVTNTGEYALGSNITPDGYYSFILQANRNYAILLEVTGYENVKYNFSTIGSENTSLQLNLEMNSKEGVPIRAPRIGLIDSSSIKKIEQKSIETQAKEYLITDPIKIKGRIHQPNHFTCLISGVNYKLFDYETDEFLKEGFLNEIYELTLNQDKKYRIEFSHDNHQTISFLIDTNKHDEQLMFMDFYMFPE